MKQFLLFLAALSGVFSGKCLADECDSNPFQWNEDSWIHSHISLRMPASDAAFVDQQLKDATVDTVHFHCTFTTELIDAVKELYPDRRPVDYRLTAIINAAGVWYEDTYPEDERYSLRINADGTPATRWTRKHLCFNSPAVDQIIIPQKYMGITRQVQPDQVWIDEAVITVNICYCDHCRDLYKKIYDESPPLELKDDNWEKWEQWVTFHRRSHERWMQKVLNAIHSVKPDTLVTFNRAYGMEQPELVPSWIKNLSMDVHKDTLEMSMVSRYCDGTGLPFDVQPGLGNDSWAGVEPKTLDQVMHNISLIVAHGGRWNIGEYPTNYDTLKWEGWSGKVDRRPADKYIEHAVKGSQFAREREEFCKGSRSIPNIALVHSARTHYSHSIANTNTVNEDDSMKMTSDGVFERSMVGRINSRIYWPNNEPVASNIVGAYMNLVETNDHFDFISEQKLLQDISKYKMVLISEQSYLEEGTAAALGEYVSDGGNLLITGSSILAGLEDLIGVKLLSEAPVKGLSFMFEGEKTDIDEGWEIKPAGAKTIVAFEEASLPLALHNQFGKGNVVYVAFDLFHEFYRRSGYNHDPLEYSDSLGALIEMLKNKCLPQDELEIAAPAWVETTLRQKNDELYLHFINRESDYKHSTGEGWTALAHVPTGYAPSGLKVLPVGKDVEFQFEDGRVSFELDVSSIDHHAAVKICR